MTDKRKQQEINKTNCEYVPHYSNYTNTCKKRGILVIISNYQLESSPSIIEQAHNANIKLFRETFDRIGDFDVHVYENKSVFEMQNIMDEYAKNSSKDYACFMAYFFTRGYLDHDLRQRLCGLDKWNREESLYLIDLTNKFKRSKPWADKPKVFFFDCGRQKDLPLKSKVIRILFNYFGFIFVFFFFFPSIYLVDNYIYIELINQLYRIFSIF